MPRALSHLAHGSYAGSPRDDAYTRLATLGPHDPGVFQSHYVAVWDRLSAYEKCLLAARYSGIPDAGLDRFGRHA